MRQRLVGVGARQEHQHVGPGGKGAPRLDAVDHPAPRHRRGRRDDVRHVGAVVGLGHGHGGQDLGRRQPGQPLLLLLLGAAVHQGTGQDLGPGDERAADAQRPPAELLGGDDHAHVVALAARGEAAVLLGHRQAEPAELGQPLDDLLGDVGVRPVHVLGVGPHLVLGEAVERLAHQLEVLAQVPRPLDGGQGGQHLRVALGPDEGGHRVGPPRLDPPLRLASSDLPGQVGHDVGHEGSGNGRLVLPMLAVLEDGPGRRHRGGRVEPRRRPPPGWRRCRRGRVRPRRPGRRGVGPGPPPRRRRRAKV